MEEKNNSKQVLLSIIGIAVLVIAVVGVSFAFFSYSRTGTSNNVITTGQIFMAFADTNNINLTNQFPTLDADAVIKGVNTDVEKMDFTVTGYYSAATGGINYTIYAIDGDAVGGRTNRLRDSEINVKLTPKSTTTLLSNAAGPTTASGSGNAAAVSTLTTDTNGRILATGKIQPGTTSAAPQTDSFELIMYVNDTVRISDTDLNVKFTGAHTETMPVTYCASARVENEGAYVSGCKIYDNAGTKTVLAENASSTGKTFLTVYSTLYYSLKLKVVGNE